MVSIVPIIREKIKHLVGWGREYESELFVGSVVILSSILTFGVGALAFRTHEKPPVVIRAADGSVVRGIVPKLDAKSQAPLLNLSRVPKASSATASEAVVAPSISGAKADLSGFIVGTRSTKKYRLPGCSGISSVAEKNRVYFKTEADAKKAGYVIVKTCKSK